MLERIAHETGVVFYRSPLLHRAGIPHGFSTRIGGVSAGPFDSLNLGNPSGPIQDDVGLIEQNYARFMAATGLAGRWRRRVFQVHGCAVVDVAGEQPPSPEIQADAMASTDSACALSVRTADCVPILLATEDGRCVAAVHAGWRGVIASIIPAAVSRLRAMHDRTGASLIAAIGPSISGDAFEVGPEVAEQFIARFGRDVIHPSSATPHVDLRESIRRQLAESGIPQHRIDNTDRCTVAHGDEFYSHRRDKGVTGRMSAMIGALSQ